MKLSRLLPFQTSKSLSTLVDSLSHPSLHKLPTADALLRRCAAAAAAGSAHARRHAPQIHAFLFKSGLLLSSPSPLAGHLIALYAKCGLPSSSRRLFDELPQPDVVSWSALISLLAQSGLHSQAISAFSNMHFSGVLCNQFTFPTLLKSCANSQDLLSGLQIHALVLSTGFSSDPFVANSLALFYSKLGLFPDAWKLANGVISWNTLLSAHAQTRGFYEALSVFSAMGRAGIKPNEFTFSCLINACADVRDLSHGEAVHCWVAKLGHGGDSFTANALVDMYAKSGDLSAAERSFREINRPDTVSWNSLIAGFVLSALHLQALELFSEMTGENDKGLQIPNQFTISSALTACAGAGLLPLGESVHGGAIKLGFEADAFVRVGIIDFYGKLGRISSARVVFLASPELELTSCNAMVSGYVHSGSFAEALEMFVEVRRSGCGFNRTTVAATLKAAAGLSSAAATAQLHAMAAVAGLLSDGHVINGLVDAYGKSGDLGSAKIVFFENPFADVVSLTSMATALVQTGEPEQALELFMAASEDPSLKPDAFLFSAVFNACASLSSLELGKQLHSQAFKLGLLRDNFAANSLVCMYAKSGDLSAAEKAFFQVQGKETVAWSAIIAGHAYHGHGLKALALFQSMTAHNVEPNHVTLTSVLSACAHSGLIHEAEKLFSTIAEKTEEHYSCMVDALGRAGRVEAAAELVRTMPVTPGPAVWGALLAAARAKGDVELGRRAAAELFAVEPAKAAGTHVLLANTYAAAGLWDEVAGVRKTMKLHRVKKEPAMSWIELRGKVHAFVARGWSHPLGKEIRRKLEELGEEMERRGYVAMVEADLHDVGWEEKKRLLAGHSERLAVALGLISTPKGATILVKKNLRVCVDCHKALKLISEIECREIVVRDINRFHHFRDGSCSCGDYW